MMRPRTLRFAALRRLCQLAVGGLCLLVAAESLAGSADMSGNVSYDVSGGRATLRVGRIQNDTSNLTTGTLYVTLRFTRGSSPSSTGYTVARARITGSSNGQLGPGQYFSNVVLNADYDAPPSGTYYAHMFTSQYPNLDTALDVHTFSGTVTVGGGGGGGGGDAGDAADMSGNVSYDVSGGRATLRVGRIQNDTSNLTTGTLYVTLRFTRGSSPSSTGYTVARARITGSSNGQLGPGQYFSNVVLNADYDAPPSGTYYAHMFTSQYPNLDTALDVHTFSGTVTVGGGGGGGGGDAGDAADMSGNVSYDVSGGRATLRVGRIQNDTSNLTTGTLYVTLRFTRGSSPSSTGYTVARARITGSSNGQLGPGQYFSNVVLSADYDAPPSGTYYAHMFTSQYPNLDTALDVHTFSGTVTVGGGGGGGGGGTVSSLEDAGSHLGDFNGDGRDDVLVRHTNGRWFYYPMNGRFPMVSQRGHANLTTNTAWRFAGIGDLDGDGRDDVLMRHTNGRWFYYAMNGRRVIANRSGIANLTTNTAWRFAGIGDLDGDGRDDVLVRHTNGRWFYYAMNGRRVIANRSGIANLTTNTAWRFAGIGDLDGDGRDDVLMRHTNGRWFYYAMNGRRVIANRSGIANLTTNATWRFAGIADMNGDRRDDVLMRNTDGRWFYYPMNGRFHITAQRGPASLTTNTAWMVRGIGDLNGDGRHDVLLRHTNGRWYYYAMNGRHRILRLRGTANLTTNRAWSIPAQTTSVGRNSREAPTPVPDHGEVIDGVFPLLDTSGSDGSPGNLAQFDTAALKNVETPGSGSSPVPEHDLGAMADKTILLPGTSDPDLPPDRFAHFDAAATEDVEFKTTVPYFASASSAQGQGRLRIINHSDEEGEVQIAGTDEDGTSAGPITLSLSANQVVHLSSRDLEDGNAARGLPAGLGEGSGNWRLEMTGDLDVEALTYFRAADGFLSPVHEAETTRPDGEGSVVHRVPFFHSAGGIGLQSRLRLINLGEESATVTITGRDDEGEEGEDEVRVTIPAGVTRTLSAQELESGDFVSGQGDSSGSLGDGTGEWQLILSADADVAVMNVLRGRDGRFADLSAHRPLGDAHVIPFFASASNAPLQGLLRIVNHSDEDEEVQISGTDDGGTQSGPVTLSLPANASVHLSSSDFEDGNASKGLPVGLGEGSGDWRLELTGDSDFEPVAFVRTADGFLSPVHEVGATQRDADGGVVHDVPYFRSAGDGDPKSRLRLVNLGEASVAVTIAGRDDTGEAAADDVQVTIPSGAARTVTAQELQSGNFGTGQGEASGRLGEGTGDWRLSVSADGDVAVVNFLYAPDGRFADFSSSTGLRRSSSANQAQPAPSLADFAILTPSQPLSGAAQLPQ